MHGYVIFCAGTKVCGCVKHNGHRPGLVWEHKLGIQTTLSRLLNDNLYNHATWLQNSCQIVKLYTTSKSYTYSHVLNLNDYTGS